MFFFDLMLELIIPELESGELMRTENFSLNIFKKTLYSLLGIYLIIGVLLIYNSYK